ANNTPVTVLLPFRLGTLESTTGLVILLSVLVGSVATALAMTLALAWRRMAHGYRTPEPSDSPTLAGDRPPADYGATPSGGFSDARCSRPGTFAFPPAGGDLLRPRR